MSSLLRLLAVLLLLTTSSQAARAPDWAKKSRTEAAHAMKEGKWEEALKIFHKVQKAMDDRTYIDTQWLGWFVYHQGLTELRLEKFEAAMKSFEKHYKKYPSHPVTKGPR